MNDFHEQLHRLIDQALKEDVGSGDHTTLSCILAGKKGRAVLKIKQEGILAGVDIARAIFSYKEPLVSFNALKEDGDSMMPGEKAFDVDAHVHTILKCERLVLNCMQRMSGIATLTRAYAEKLKGYKTKVLDTRKTTPNFRLLEKEAVRIGGGVNHRFGLFDMILFKDNHIDYCGGIETALDRAWEYVQKLDMPLKIEIEARSLDDVRRIKLAGKGRLFRVLLDNFEPPVIGEALKIIEGEFETEASGGINLENIEAYATTGVDFISIGALVHQAKSLDLSLKASL